MTFFLLLPMVMFLDTVLLNLLQPSDRNTPHISEVNPRTTEPGELVNVYGKLITEKISSTVEESTNGESAQMVR